MGTRIITFDKITGEAESIKTCSCPEDILLNIDQSKFDYAIDDVGVENPTHWHYKNGKMEKKPQAVIDAEETARKAAEDNRREPEYLRSDEQIHSDILLENINALRAKTGLPALTPGYLQNEVATRREQFRNPKKI